MDSWNTRFLLDGLFSGAMLVSGRVLTKLVHLSCFNLNNLQVEEYRVHLRLERHWSWVFVWRRRDGEGSRKNAMFPKTCSALMVYSSPIVDIVVTFRGKGYGCNCTWNDFWFCGWFVATVVVVVPIVIVMGLLLLGKCSFHAKQKERC